MTAVAILPYEEDNAPTGTVTYGELAEYIGHHIRAYRKALRLSGQDLANILGFNVNTLYGWETGDRIPALRELLVVATVLDKPLSAFLPRGGDA